MSALRTVGRKLATARERLRVATEAAERATIDAHADGTAETVIARELGVNRLTVRKWLGKL